MLTTDSDGVIPAAGGIDQAPSIEERQIVDVDLERVDDRRINVHRAECQHCGDAVELRDPHAWACLWSSHTDAAGRIMYKPVFCDRWCWLDWLRTGKEEER